MRGSKGSDPEKILVRYKMTLDLEGPEVFWGGLQEPSAVDNIEVKNDKRSERAIREFQGI